MKTTKTTHTATYAEANKGVAFKNIISLPPFSETSYSLTGDSYKARLTETLRNIVFPSLPSECAIENNYSGILATDLFSLNTLLGSMIENKVVMFLNAHRHLWDDGSWREYHFIRSNESFLM